MNQQQPFYVGLCMAGAVSAGAYTAGVIDFLIEALENWETNRGKPGVPNHRVKIPVIGGASAGGMTGIITASAINHAIKPVSKIDPTDFFKSHPENKFWHSWVDMIDKDMFPHLLKNNDISKGHILSLFNSSFIDAIAERALQVSSEPRIDRQYFEKNLKLFTTLTSLRGLSYNVDFLGVNQDPDKYCISRHNDYVTFEVNTTQYKNDGWIPLDFTDRESVKLAKDAAMATGAFPVGLRSREVSRKIEYMNDNAWLRDITSISPVKHDPYVALNVDGGVINNEPFEKVRDVLISLTGQGPAQFNSYNHFTSTVLMIDPFPSEPPLYNDSDKLVHVVGSTLSALINQVRVKPQYLEDAMASDKSGQFLITPSRTVPRMDGLAAEKQVGSRAIACGAFEGFSGFLHKEFRIHDYFLGRANCEKFLRDHFTVPADSTNLVVQGYAHLSEDEKIKYYSISDKKKSVPIIPVISTRTAHKYMPVFSSGTDWPIRLEEEIDRFKDPAQDRIYSMIMNLAEYSWWMHGFLAIGTWAVLKRRIARVALNMIKQSLANHQLLKSKDFKPQQRKQQPGTVKEAAVVETTKVPV
jgi:predicted acylesterase/phospholipase RssA